MIFNFKITADDEISKRFRALGVNDFMAASQLVRNLPYRRNSDKDDPYCVLQSGGGTCSIKHALLKRLADENGISDEGLMLGIFMMDRQNTPKITTVLNKYKLNEMPEAHNYLRWKDLVLDYTSRKSSADDFISHLENEIEIQPDQITDFKIKYHQNFLRQYLDKNPAVPYPLEEFWRIREECIAALQQ